MNIFDTIYRQQKGSEFKTARRLVFLTSVIFLCLLLWQSYSASKAHHQYQASLMTGVTDNLLIEIQDYLARLRREIDLFQQRHNSTIFHLYQQKRNATTEQYMPLRKALNKAIANTRLFAIIDENGSGTLTHITGNFLPDCQEEISSTINNGAQELLFLHRSKKNVHFDLLQPLLATPNQSAFFLTSFTPIVLETLLKRYQLPHQQLFLMRSDNTGKIELSSEQALQQMTMSAKEFSRFSHIKAIPGTRWQLAIRLSPEYSSQLYWNGLINAVGIWLLLTLVIWLFYYFQKARILKSLQMVEQLNYHEQHDKLTGLANRTYFEQSLAQLLAQREAKPQSSGAVLLVDIDQFKVVNNNLGYATGDKILFQLSIAIKAYIVEPATICRLGNDEFAILLPQLPHAQTHIFADKLRHFIQILEFSDINPSCQISACIGVVKLELDQIDTGQILSSLNLCVRLAKQKGRNRIQMYQSNDQQLQQHAQEMTILHDLSIAIRDKQLVLYRQAIKPLQAQQGRRKYEILVRMTSAEHGIIPPNVFIPAAEKYGFIKQLDYAVIEKTFRTLRRSPNDNNHYCVNLSGATLSDKDTFNNIQSLFESYQVDAKRITFEITETATISHFSSAIKLINNLAELGFQFSLDDFGSGVSSFSYLQKLPVSTIKIDGAFVHDLDTNKINRIFVENIVRTACAMNKQTVAEYVENAAIEKILIELGIHFGQGFYIHKPSLWHESELEPD